MLLNIVVICNNTYIALNFKDLKKNIFFFYKQFLTTAGLTSKFNPNKKIILFGINLDVKSAVVKKLLIKKRNFSSLNL